MKYVTVNTADHELVGIYQTHGDAKAALEGKPSRLVTELSEKGLEVLTNKDLVGLYNAAAERPIKKFKNSETGRARAVEALNALPFTEVKETEVAKTAKEKKPRTSKKQALRDLFIANPDKLFSRKELENTLKAPWNIIGTYISDLKNPKYAGGDVMIIEHDKESDTYSLSKGS